jgi:hypothetical protein
MHDPVDDCGHLPPPNGTVPVAANASAFSYAVLVEVDRLRQRFQRRGCVQGAVRPEFRISRQLGADNLHRHRPPTR